jgi:hypothetical protein
MGDHVDKRVVYARFGLAAASAFACACVVISYFTNARLKRYTCAPVCMPVSLSVIAGYRCGRSVHFRYVTQLCAVNAVASVFAQVPLLLTDTLRTTYSCAHNVWPKLLYVAYVCMTYTLTCAARHEVCIVLHPFIEFLFGLTQWLTLPIGYRCAAAYISGPAHIKLQVVDEIC